MALVSSEYLEMTSSETSLEANKKRTPRANSDSDEATTKDAKYECMEFTNPMRERDFDAEQPEQPEQPELELELELKQPEQPEQPQEMDPPDPSGIDPGASDNAPTRSVMQLWRRRDQAAQEEQMCNDGRGAGLNPAAVDAMMQL
jgi:hypothetical protein